MAAQDEVLNAHPEQFIPPTNTAWHAAPAVNTAATVTFPARATHRQVIYKVTWSYDDFPTGGQLTIATGGEVLHTWYIFSAGPGFIPVMVAGKLAQNLTVTLAAGGAGVSGSVSVEKHWEKQN